MTAMHTTRQTTRRSRVTPEQCALREALAPYVNVAKLRQLAVRGGDLRQALCCEQPPTEIDGLLQALSALLEPLPREQIRCPADLAALLMVDMCRLDQEELRVVCLDTKNQVQTIHTVYVGSLNSAIIGVGEVFKEALKLNSAAIIVVHNHPSGDPIPSPEDVAVTRQIVQTGELLDIECLDHLVIGQGRWVSLRERGLGWHS